MSYHLRDDLHVCVTSGHAVFLDVAANRYFALDRPATMTFERLLSGDADVVEGPVARSLVERGYLVAGSDQDKGVHVTRGIVARTSAIQAGRSASLAPAMWAALAMMIALAGLRLCSFSATLARYRHVAGLTAPVAATRSAVIIQSTLAAFDAGSVLVTGHDRCLARSLALAAMLARRGVATKVVIGVRMHPFMAHCWVQRDEVVLNDDLDSVATYTPILIL
jgi:hypothetical protein